jgi:hypothetical protein
MKIKSQSLVGSIKLFSYPILLRPKFLDSLKFPEEITELTSQNVSDLIGKYSQAYAYVNQARCQLVIAILKAEAELSEVQSQIFKGRPSINFQERWRRDAIVETDQRIAEIRVQAYKLRQQKEYTEMWLQNLDRYLTALSRELTRKMQDQSYQWEMKAKRFK